MNTLAAYYGDNGRSSAPHNMNTCYLAPFYTAEATAADPMNGRDRLIYGYARVSNYVSPN
jgi:hypothetical protein